MVICQFHNHGGYPNDCASFKAVVFKPLLLSLWKIFFFQMKLRTAAPIQAGKADLLYLNQSGETHNPAAANSAQGQTAFFTPEGNE